MLGKILPILIMGAGLGGGIGAGFMLRPTPVAEAAPKVGQDIIAGAPCGEGLPNAVLTKSQPAQHEKSEFAKMTNQFVFPLVEDGEVSSLVVLSLSLEVAPGQTEAIFVREPKLRDRFLRVMLDHANAGGFNGAFTGNESMQHLRSALLEKGREDLGEALYDVLILDINRQDV